MARNTLSRGGSGGGPGSKALNKPTTYYTGQPARVVQPAGVSQLGSQMGNKAMDSGGKVLPNPATPMYGGQMGGVGAVPLGNSLATNVGGGGPGTGRTLYGQSGTNACHGQPYQGEARPAARGFDSRTIVKKI